MKYLLVLFNIWCFFIFSNDFDSLMGDNKRYIQTKLDKDNYDLYKSAYQKSISLNINQENIPKVLHIVWIDEKKPTKRNISIFKKWKSIHKNWKVNVWTNKKHYFKKKDFNIFLVKNLIELDDMYDRAVNYVEKETLLKLEILLKEGGIVISRNIECIKSLDELNKFSFYCALHPLSNPVGNSSIFASNQIIASKPCHPILKESVAKIKRNWSHYGMAFPNIDFESCVYKTVYRTEMPFDEAVKENMSSNDIVFPSSYFFEVDNKAIYAKALNNPSRANLSDSFENRSLILIEKAYKNIKNIFYVNIGFLVFILSYFLYKKKS